MQLRRRSMNSESEGDANDKRALKPMDYAGKKVVFICQCLVSRLLMCSLVGRGGLTSTRYSPDDLIQFRHIHGQIDAREYNTHSFVGALNTASGKLINFLHIALFQCRG